VVVVTVFLVSWLEALFILPAHLAHRAGGREPTPWLRPLDALRRTLQNGLTHFTQQRFEPFLQRALNLRLLTVSLAIAVLAVAIAWSMSGRMGFSLMPRVESDRVQATVTLPVGSPIAEDRRIRDQLLDAAMALAERDDGPSFTTTRAQIDGDRLNVRLTIERDSLDAWPPSRVAREWRNEAGDIMGAQAVRFESDFGGPGAGAALTLRLSHSDSRVLEAAATRLADELTEFEGLTDIDSGLADGKPQLELRLAPEGRALGLTGADLAAQLRGPLQGVTAIEQFVGRHEISIAVRLPSDERDSLGHLHQLPIRTADGQVVPLQRIAEIHLGRAATTLQRVDGRRQISVTADTDSDAQINQVVATLQADVFPSLQAAWPGLELTLGGRQQDTAENVSALTQATWLTLIALYALLAIPFRSYLQPLLVLAAIPFGVIGAMAGHAIMGFGLSVISLLGMLALSGVVINDALVLIDYANRRRREGFGAREAIVSAATRRLRPILMTTMTTFLGLAPMIFETSRQARFIIPMAISLGFGMLFATVILLVLVPCLYLMLERVRERWGHQSHTHPTQEPTR
jgi:multidrug efflux pump subunit AcrB